MIGAVEWWTPEVPMAEVLARIDPANNAKAEFTAGVVGIMPDEYEAALAAAADRPA
ncbi:hypothetical protein G7085_06760 [Tessaracoccus sp. HDW20]|uniref:hypothetical protein n=1 Tax=Tessaracoccus coleopterorum TaxID=2714950 RepID=UPI0018D2B6BA|nr:hypothetical protein [Tessaracoccus coleopterorum]NHB84405.1 hypothetical protein [Tessaracoccus coleopterorum]